MVEHDPADVERRLRAREWLSTTEVAVLFGRDRTTVYRWVRRGLIGHRISPGGGELECDPADVTKLLAEYRTVRRGDNG
jgi:predicted site-specific integrase-resolvase